MWAKLSPCALWLAVCITIVLCTNVNSQRHRKSNKHRTYAYPPRESSYDDTELFANIFPNEEDYFLSVQGYIKHHQMIDENIDSTIPKPTSIGALYQHRSNFKRRHHRRHSGHKSDRPTNRSSRRSLEESYQLEIPWPVKKEAVIDGDLVLGGLMMVHSREDSVTCGAVMPQGGVQALEAMLYTLDRVNSDKTLLPNITLGAHILDDCDKDTYGLEMAVDFIKGA